MNIIIVKE